MLPMTPAWTVYAWPPVLWQAARAPRLHLTHLGTSVLKADFASGPNSGQTLWAQSDRGDGSAGVAWDWIELRDGVVAIADPLGVITNLTLLDAHGEALSPVAAALHLNQLVHSLPWQTEVCRALQLQPNS
ncbi:MAG: hypothetical protein ABIX46_13240 [Burkholderiaceae bacterium]